VLSGLHSNNPLVNMSQQSQVQQSKLQLQIARGIVLPGILSVVPGSSKLVIFVHGSGSSHQSPRNQYVARLMNEANISTFLCDLLTKAEEREDNYTAELRFNIPFLTTRVNAIITKLLEQHTNLANMQLGTFGASTGGAAAIRVAVERGDIKAVVSRGGRPDLVEKEYLAKLTAPTQLLVGSLDTEVIRMNQTAYNGMKLLKEGQNKQLYIVPGASHLFEERGTLEVVAREACAWFNKFCTIEGQSQQGTAVSQQQTADIPSYRKTEIEEPIRPDTSKAEY